MKRLIVILAVLLSLIFALASCDSNGSGTTDSDKDNGAPCEHSWAIDLENRTTKCRLCGEEKSTECLIHSWSTVDCGEYPVCNFCGKISDVMRDHRWTNANCENPEICSACGISASFIKGHKWQNADCENPAICFACGKTSGEPLGHSFGDMDCENPAICLICGKPSGEAREHNFGQADCDTPATCTDCGKTSGNALGHNFSFVSCDSPMACTVCGKAQGSAVGHSWLKADCENPKRCKRCSATQGSALEHKASGTWNINDDGSITADCVLCGKAKLSAPEHAHTFEFRDEWGEAVYSCAGCEVKLSSADIICLEISDASDAGYYRMEISAKVSGVVFGIEGIIEIVNSYSAAEVKILSKSFDFVNHWYENIALIREVRLGNNISAIDKIVMFPMHKLFISESVKLIREDALSDCGTLRDVYFEGDLPILEKDALWSCGGGSNDDGTLYEYLPVAWYNEGAAGFEAYGKVIQGYMLKKIGEPEAALPDMSMGEYAEKSAEASIAIAEALLKDWDKKPLAFLTLVPQCDITEYKRIKDLTLELTKDASSDYERALIIFNWIVENIEYDDYAREAHFTVDRAFDERRAVCSQYASIMHDMLAAVGIPSLYTRGISYFGTMCTVAELVNEDYLKYEDDTHAWLIVYIGGEAIICDPTWGDFDISPEEMKDTCRATTMVEGVDIVVEGIDFSLYPRALTLVGDELYYFINGRISVHSGHGAIILGSHEYMYRFRSKHDGYASYNGVLPPLNAAYRDTVITYDNMGYANVQCINSGYVEISYRKAIAFVALEKLYYGNEYDLPYNDDFIIAENGVIYLKLDGGKLSVFSTCSQEDSIAIPETVSGMTVTEIHSSAFRDTDFIEILLPDTVEKIGFHAFLSCAKLESLVLPRGLKHIEPGAFAWCDSLESVTIYAGLQTVGFLTNHTVCIPNLVFEDLNAEKLKVYFVGTDEELSAINFHNPFGNDEVGYIDLEQKEHFLSFIVK